MDARHMVISPNVPMNMFLNEVNIEISHISIHIVNKLYPISI